MRGNEHVALAVAPVFLIGLVPQLSHGHLEATSLLLPVAAAATGALAPDIDHPYSLISLRIPATMLSTAGGLLLLAWLPGLYAPAKMFDVSNILRPYLPLAWAVVAVSVMLLALSIAAQRTLRHRGQVHSLVVGAVASLVVLVALAVLRAPLWLSSVFAWGWISHLFADGMTPKRLPYLLWPFVDTTPLQESPGPAQHAHPADSAPESVDSARKRQAAPRS